MPERVIAIHHHLKVTDERLKVSLSNGKSLEVTTVHRFYDPALMVYRPISDFKVGEKLAWLAPESAKEELAVPGFQVPPAQRFVADRYAQPEARLAAVERDVTITRIDRLPKVAADVYNISMDGLERNYLADGILVHNLKPVGGGCFVAGTPVKTPTGEKAIESLKPGDAIYAVDPRTFELVPTRVAKVLHHPRQRDQRVRLTFSNGRELVATTVHPFYDPRKQSYAPIGSFSVGDKVVWVESASDKEAAALPEMQLPAAARHAIGEAVIPSANRLAAVSREVTITSIERLGDAPTDVFNLSVESDFHDYLSNGILVHNGLAKN
jgi:hypothetical protein